MNDDERALARKLPPDQTITEAEFAALTSDEQLEWLDAARVVISEDDARAHAMSMMQMVVGRRAFGNVDTITNLRRVARARLAVSR